MSVHANTFLMKKFNPLLRSKNSPVLFSVWANKMGFT